MSPKPEFSVVRGRYCKDEVDAYVRLVGETIARLEARIAEFEQIPVSERIAEAELEADQLIQRARQEADSMIAQAVSREAQEIVTTMNARVELEKTLTSVRSEADGILENARQQADTILGEVRVKAETMYSGVVNALEKGEMTIGIDPTSADLVVSPAPQMTPLPLLDEVPLDSDEPAGDEDRDDNPAAELAAAVDAVANLLGQVDGHDAEPAEPHEAVAAGMSAADLWDSTEDPSLAEHPFFSEEIDDDPSRKWILAS